jgi:hypothetical protein
MTYISEAKFIFMGKRRLRICRHRQYDGRVPEVRLGGKWFAEQGFNVGDFIDLILERNQIIIRHTPYEEIAHLVEEPKRKR